MNVKITPTRCSGIINTGYRCSNEKFVTSDTYFCAIHTYQEGKNVKYKICSGMNKNGTKCIEGKAVYENKYYCREHEYQIGKVFKYIECGCINKNGSSCQNKGITCIGNYICHIHKKYYKSSAIDDRDKIINAISKNNTASYSITDVIAIFNKYGKIDHCNICPTGEYIVSFIDSKDIENALANEPNTERNTTYSIVYYPNGNKNSTSNNGNKNNGNKNKGNKNNDKNTSNIKKLHKLVACQGKTAAGGRCKRRAMVDGVYWCKSHISQKNDHINKCSSKRKDGERCRNYVNYNDTHCNVHSVNV